jgi:hypothetical protein
MMSFLKQISDLKQITEYFGLDREPIKGNWPRKVESWELPPERIPILPPDQVPPLPPGLRDAERSGHRGWQEWKRPQPQQRRTNILRHADVNHMGDYLRDGAVAPPRGDK